MNIEDFALSNLSVEISILLYGCILALIHIILQGGYSTYKRGAHWALGPRDSHIPIEGIALRVEKAAKNFFETFPIAIVLIIVVDLYNKSSDLSKLCSLFWLLSRIAYLPAYISGSMIRPLVWFCSILSLFGIFISILK